MKKLIPQLMLVFLLVFVSSILSPAFSQTKTVKIKREKETPSAWEYILVWEGGDYKTTYYEIQNILDSYPALQKQVFLWKLKSISAFVSKEQDTSDLLNLFRQNGFEAIDLNNGAPPLPSAN